MMRQATEQDFATVWRILRQAASRMMAQGRDQWDDKYPTAEAVHADIARGEGWVVERDGRVVAYCAIALGGEPSPYFPLAWTMQIVHPLSGNIWK